MARTTLEYRPERGPNHTSVWLNVALSIYPVALLGVLQGLYVVEWFNNGERPIPPHHGPDGRVESALYWLTGAFFIGALPALLVHVLVIAWHVRNWAGEKTFQLPTKLTRIGFGGWGGGFLLLVLDPFGSLSFFLD